MRVVLAILFSLLATSAFAAEPCAPRPAVAPALARLETAMATDRFVTYNPTGLKVYDGNVTPATAESIRADLKALRPYFDGLITYSARDGLEHVPDIAAELGFKAIVIGLWTPADPEELRNAITAAKKHPKLVVGISLGNEIVFGKRGTWANLQSYLALTRARVPDVPLTVSEPFAQFLDSDAGDVRGQLDFMLVNIHPIFEKWFATAGPDNWADFVAKVTDKLRAAYCGPILVKETGLPSGPPEAGYDATKQAAFWRAMEAHMKPARDRAFSYFAAFDAPWRTSDFNPVAGHHPEEAFWGLFTEARAPKPAITGLAKLAR
jgi:exo-beta-1,3-glucanase (GH17 family)